MGNHNSHSSGRALIHHHHPQTQQWPHHHSFPRDVQRAPHLKVLPEDGLGQRLRSTDNGAILNAEGTIRGGRRSFRNDPSEFHSGGIQRSKSVHDNHQQAHDVGMFHRTRTQMFREKNGSSFTTQSKRFGSEPDLRSPTHTASTTESGFGAKNRISRGKKKYKAPAPPTNGGEGSSPDSYHWELASAGDTSDSAAPQRKLRLFKTRAETHRHGHVHRCSSNDEPPTARQNCHRYTNNRDDNAVVFRKERDLEGPTSKRNSAPPVVMHRSLSSPEFQAELRAVTEKLRVIGKGKYDPKYRPINEVHETKTKEQRRKQNWENKKVSKMVTMDHNNIPAKQRLLKSFKENVEKLTDTIEDYKEGKITKAKEIEKENTRNQPSGKESTPEKPTTKKPDPKPTEEFKTPAKTFYFGMDMQQEQNKLQKQQVKEEFENLLTYKIQNQSSSESALSSEPDLEPEQQSNPNDISMQLRPTLPKKQLDIPRFSPATAWRLLSIVDATANHSNGFNENEEVPVFMEERIERLARPTPNIPLLGHRSSYDKSGDSGISGDAGPPLIEDISEPLMPNTKNSSRSPLVAWTPQQDLDEEGSSSDGGLEITKINPSNSDVKFNARNHVFSLSLPREAQVVQYAGSDKSRPTQGFNSLQKLRRSLGAALGAKNTRTNDDAPVDIDDNWFLSTSAPNSLNHSSTMYRLSRTQSEDDEDNKQLTLLNKESTMLKSPTFTYLANGGHVMYLPKDDKITEKNSNNRDVDEFDGDVQLRHKQSRNHKSMYRSDRIKSIEIPCRKEFNAALKRLPTSKSCENISYEMKQINDRTPSPNRKQMPKLSNIEEKRNSKSKGKRFTFQSTVRQIERKRIADRLSKEAERKEKQRLSELEAMRRVEEEFQKKRAREKASIRQQLRLYSLDENNQSNWEQSQLRSEPDGAVSSSPAPSPTSNLKMLTSNVRDIRTPYVNKIVEQKMCKTQQKEHNNNNVDSYNKSNKKLDNYEFKPSPVITKKRFNKNDHRSSPITRSSDDSRIKTEILSEYRQPMREYREYRSFTRLSNSDSIEPQTTVHPQVVYNMPKASQVNSYHEVDGSMSPHSDNYRRDFAHGAVPTSSDSELSQPNTRSHSPRHQLSRLRPRSNSPDCDRDNEDNNNMETAKVDDIDMDVSNSEPKIIEMLDKTNEHPNAVVETKDNSIVEHLVKLCPQPFTPGKSFKPVCYKVK